MAENKTTNVTQDITQLVIKPPNFRTAEFQITGDAPLVIHRMSQKYVREQEQKIRTGKPSASKRNREAQDPNEIFNSARYISVKGWDGIHAGAFRNAMISACRLVNFKMTLAKLSIFIIADGCDELEPQIPLVRIIGKAIMQKDVVRMADGTPNLAFRPAYHDWKAVLKVRWDADQFTIVDVANLLARVGMQVGVGEDRPDSKNGPGMGWGTFTITCQKE